MNIPKKSNITRVDVQNLSVNLNNVSSLKTEKNISCSVRVENLLLVLSLNEIANIITKKSKPQVPEKNVKVYVWDGNKPQYPTIAYSNNNLVSKEIEVFYSSEDTEFAYYKNWEVVI